MTKTALQKQKKKKGAKNKKKMKGKKRALKKQSPLKKKEGAQKKKSRAEPFKNTPKKTRPSFYIA